MALFKKKYKRYSTVVEPIVDKSPEISDEVRQTTCYMCACRCGINVHVKDEKIRYIEGNRDHPINKGVLCAKGSAGIMQHYSPARLRSPMKRVGPRGSGRFKNITWEEALEMAANWLAPIRKSDPKKTRFFYGKDQSQALKLVGTTIWNSQFCCPRGFCSVNMAAAGVYTVGEHFGNLVRQTGIEQNCLFYLVWQRIMTQTL